MKYEVTVYSI